MISLIKELVRKLFPHVYIVSGKTVDQMEKILKKNKNVDYVERLQGNKDKFKKYNSNLSTALFIRTKYDFIF